PAGPRPASPSKLPPPRDDQYLQKQALLDQPLSLDDLLRDDLDEGPQPMAGSDVLVIEESAEPTTNRGGVIDYEDDFSSLPAPRTSKPKEFGRRRGGPGSRHRPKGRDHR